VICHYSSLANSNICWKILLERCGMNYLLLLLRKLPYFISIEKEGIVIGCQRIFNFKTKQEWTDVYSSWVHVFSAM
jgi:hypothetical protein